MPAAHPSPLVLRGKTLDFTSTAVVGIVNVTPDSFSDGGRYLDVDAAVGRGVELAREGAHILDVGGESTRPGARPVESREELARVIPVIRALRAEVDLPISIDTHKAEVAWRALDAGADLVNDISGLRWDPEMAPVVARAGIPVVIGHARGDRGSMHEVPAYGDVGAEVARDLAQALERAEAVGIPRERVLLDPGIGFSKSPRHNLELLRDLRPLCALGRPVLVGVSRKSFLGRVTGRPVGERALASAAATVAAILAGANLVRVHEVAPLLDAIRVADAIRHARLPGLG